MKITLNKNMFIDMFTSYGRFENFGYEGLCSLFDYIEETEEDCNIEFEADVVGLCCQYVLYNNIDDYNNDYNTDFKSYEDIDKIIIPVDDKKFIVDAES